LVLSFALERNRMIAARKKEMRSLDPAFSKADWIGIRGITGRCLCRARFGVSIT
jgi:hypothetical protein